MSSATAPPDNDPRPVYSHTLLTELLRMLIGTAATMLLLTVIFPPHPMWPLAFVALVPWGWAVCRTERAWVVHWLSFLLGWLFFLFNLIWLMPVTGLGFVALAFYLAIYWPMTAWAMRTALRWKVAVVWVFPLAWVACEFLRGWVMTGFPWLFLAHAFYQHTTFIQISDITGAYGVSFLAALVNGILIDTTRRWRSGPVTAAGWQWPAGIAATLVLLIANHLYGTMRLNQDTLIAGPTVAVVQEDFPLQSTEPYSEHAFVIFSRYMRLAADAAAEKPDLIVFPETVWAATQNVDFVESDKQAVDDIPAGTWNYGRRTHRATAAFARGDYATVNKEIADLEKAMGGERELPRLPAEGGPAATVVVGSVALEVFPEASYPTHKRYNSALVYDPDGTQRRQRYDKTHLVLFGEYVPFRDTRVAGISLHWLYRSLNQLSPFSQGGKVEYSLWPGRDWTAFDLATGDRTWRFATPICYEDAMPYVSRRMVWDGTRRRVDFLLNISNDGWFRYSAELEQHLAVCTFRAVENRVGIARAVNTGISGFIDPHGRLSSLVQNEGRLVAPGTVGFAIDRIMTDTRTSFYGRTGDWFAGACLLLTSFFWLSGIITRWLLAIRDRLLRRRSNKEVPA